MGLSNPQLWNGLLAYLHETPAAGGLVAKVAERLGGGKRLAQRRVDAYLRFIYLVAVSDEVLAPSKAVDAVWHLHLEDAEAYEIAFCGAVVGRKINHHEGRPAPAKDPAYSRTLIRYQEEFGRKPAPSLWPEVPPSTLIADVFLSGAVVCFVALIIWHHVVFLLLGLCLGCIGYMIRPRRRGRSVGGSDSGCGGVWVGDTAGGSDCGGGGGGDGGGGCGGD